VKKAREALKHPLVKDTIIPLPDSTEDLTNAKLWVAVAGSATAPSITQEQLFNWAKATYAADARVSTAAIVYYTAVAQRIAPNTIITRADYNSWWAAAQRDESLKTAFFYKLMVTWST